MGFGQDIKTIRKSKGLTLREAAKLYGLSATYVSKMEREEFKPCSADKISKIAEVLEIDPDVTCLKAGKIPSWIKSLLFKKPINCVSLLKEIRIR